MSCLYILGINSLSVVSFADIFSNSELSFHLASSFFAMQKLLWLIWSHLFSSVVFFFFFFSYYSRRWVIEDLPLIYAIECSTYVFL